MLTQHFIGYVTCLSRSSSRKPQVAGAKWLFLLFLREGLSLESLSFLARPESGCLRWKVLIVALRTTHRTTPFFECLKIKFCLAR
jgi:hypothetical protein